LSVLERLLIRLRQAPPARAVVIWAIEAAEHGCGRIWRTSQDPWLTTNAAAAELTMRSPDSPLTAGPDRDSLAAWSAHQPVGPRFGPDDYPPRRDYGRYLRQVFEQLRAAAPAGVRIRPVLGLATDLARIDGGLVLTLDHGRRRLRVDQAVLATGHSELEPTAEERGLAAHGDRYLGLRYLPPSIAADMALDELPAGEVVAVRGLGLTFYDVVACLTTGRGGRFWRGSGGRLRYLASGREPRLVAGSRSGLPFLARPGLTGPPQLAPRPVVLTESLVDRLRERAADRRGSGQLDFAAEIEPVIQTELDHAYYGCAVQLRRGSPAGDRFRSDFRAAVGRWGSVEHARVAQLAAEHGVRDLPGLRLAALARPFGGQDFARPSEFRDRLTRLLYADVAAARAGTAVSPLKAAMEVLRSLRPALPAIVDFGGLLPRSQRDFLDRFAPLSFLLSAGPPASQVEQLAALLETGIVEVSGPSARFGTSDRPGSFLVCSPVVRGSRRPARALIEARAPGTDLPTDTNPLLSSLRRNGLISEYVTTDPVTGERYHTGGLAVTGVPYRVIDAAGRPAEDIYAIGVVTQNTRWFTQVGTGRPGQDSPLCRDADAIALAVLGRTAVDDTRNLAG
jgi:FAD-NAD(P)-binding protein